MNSNLSNISGSPTHILNAGDSYVAGEEIGGGGDYPVFKTPKVERIVVLKEGRIGGLTETFQKQDGSIDEQSVLGEFSEVTNDLGQNIEAVDVPAGTILIPTRVAFYRVESLTAVLELHLLHQQAQTAFKVG